MENEQPKIINNEQKPKTGCGKIFVICIILMIVMSLISRCTGKTSTKKEWTNDWPDSGLALMLPEPEFKKYCVDYDSSTYFSFETDKVSDKEYNEYVKKCKEAGFVLDYINSSSYYNAESKDGYELSVNKYSDNTVHVSLSKQDKSTLTPVPTETSQPTPTLEPTPEPTPAPTLEPQQEEEPEEEATYENANQTVNASDKLHEHQQMINQIKDDAIAQMSGYVTDIYLKDNGAFYVIVSYAWYNLSEGDKLTLADAANTAMKNFDADNPSMSYILVMIDPQGTRVAETTITGNVKIKK